MKKGKLFATIVYFLFTILIGILLVIFLPFALMYFGESVNTIQKSLDAGEYDKAISLVGGYYDKVPVYQETFDNGGGIVLFTAASLLPGEIDEDGNTLDDAKLHLAYSGFLYNTKSYYNTVSNEDNKSILVVTSLDDVDHKIDLLDSDVNEDGINDCIATYKQKSFIYIDIGVEVVGSIKSLAFYDKDGNKTIQVNADLSYSESFFDDVSAFVEEYNLDYKSDKLESLDEEFRAKSANYLKSSNGIAKSSADKKAAIVVLIYFIIIYIIADFILGTHFIIKFFRWLLVKVFKVKFKTKAPKKQEVFGHDYFCKFTLQADVDDFDIFEESIQVRYSNETDEVTFILLKSRNYTATESVKAGNYVNLWVDINDKYLTKNLPDILEVEGYHKQLTFKILKRED